MHMNFTVTTNQEPTKDTQKIKRKEPKRHTKENQQTIKRSRQEGGKIELQKQPKYVQLTKWQ